MKPQSLGNTLRIQPHADFTAGGTVTGQTLQAVAAHLQEIWNSGGDLGTGFAALASLKDIPTYQHDLKTLSGQTVGAISAARFASSQAFVGNLYSCPTFDDNSLHMSERDCAWARFTNNDARQDSTADASGYRSEAQTLQLGGAEGDCERLVLRRLGRLRDQQFRRRGGHLQHQRKRGAAGRCAEISDRPLALLDSHRWRLWLVRTVTAGSTSARR